MTCPGTWQDTHPGYAAPTWVEMEKRLEPPDTAA